MVKIHTHMRTHTHVPAHTHTHPRAHTHTHTQAKRGSDLFSVFNNHGHSRTKCKSLNYKQKCDQLVHSTLHLKGTGGNITEEIGVKWTLCTWVTMVATLSFNTQLCCIPLDTAKLTQLLFLTLCFTTQIHFKLHSKYALFFLSPFKICLFHVLLFKLFIHLIKMSRSEIDTLLAFYQILV